MLSEIEIQKRFTDIKKNKSSMKGRIERLGRILKTSTPRLDKLRLQDLNIEYIAFGGQLLEYVLREVVDLYAVCVDEIIFLDKIDGKIKMDMKTHDREYLSSLITKYGWFCTDTQLVSDLDNFREEYRNEIIHKLYSTYEDVGQINSLFKFYVLSDKVSTMILKIMEDANAMLVESTSRTKYHLDKPGSPFKRREESPTENPNFQGGSNS